MIGCLFGSTGRLEPDDPATAGGPVRQHYSRFMGVVPEWHSRGVGYRLKLAQREWALNQGFQLVTWTYDPLEAANGVLNLGKLGAVCRCYLRNLYGEIDDALNAGLPTDRFEVAWWIGSTRVRERVERGWQRPRLDDLCQEGATVLNAGRSRAGGRLEPGETRKPKGERLLIEIPAHIQTLKATDTDLALAWRMSVRETCEAAFAAGYTTCDVVRAEVDGLPRVYYLLEENSTFTTATRTDRLSPPAISSPYTITPSSHLETSPYRLAGQTPLVLPRPPSPTCDKMARDPRYKPATQIPHLIHRV